jgi:hypothetical protein
MKLRAIRRVVAGLTLVAALIAMSPMSSEAAGFGQGTMVSLWALGWDWLASVGEKLGWTAVPERASSRPGARRNGGTARVWDKQGSMVDPNGCQSPSGTSACADSGTTELQPET